MVLNGSSLTPERWNFESKGTKKHPEKNCQAFPLVLRVKNQRITAGKQPTKNWQAFPPIRGVKMGNSDRQATRKTPKKTIEHSAVLIAGLNHVRTRSGG